jgi:branched-chain amino acid aminotransferase
VTAERRRAANVPAGGPPRDRRGHPAQTTRAPVVWIDGRASDAAGPHLSALDRGFTLGDGLFETMRCYDGSIFRRAQHLDRLLAGAATLGIALPADLDAMIDDAVRAGRDAGLGDAVVRLTVSRGPGAPGVAPPADAAATVVTAVHPLPAFGGATYEAGIVAHVASGRRNERAQTAGLKTLSYTDAVAALAEARQAGADDAIFLDSEDHLSEATSSNLFFMRDGVLVTPPLSCGALPGITRAVVLEIVRDTVLPCEESVATLEDLHRASEAFLTSSVREIAPLVRVGEHTLGTGTPGPVTRRVMTAYAECVRRECGAAEDRPARADAERPRHGDDEHRPTP